MIEIWNNGLFVQKLGGLNMEQLTLCVLLCAVIAYILGSLNFGVIVSKRYGEDIRTKGSGNAGSTNMLRVYGKRAAICTFLLDMAKAVAAQLLGRLILGLLGAYVAGLFCIIGHAFPLFFKFKGGKGVVCAAVMILMTTPLVFLINFLIFIIILFGFKMVSLASAMGMLIYPMLLANIMGWRDIRIIIAAICSLLIIFLHRKNIVRIYNHQESKISIGKKKRENSDENRKK